MACGCAGTGTEIGPDTAPETGPETGPLIGPDTAPGSVGTGTPGPDPGGVTMVCERPPGAAAGCCPDGATSVLGRLPGLGSSGAPSTPGDEVSPVAMSVRRASSSSAAPATSVLRDSSICSAGGAVATTVLREPIAASSDAASAATSAGSLVASGENTVQPLALDSSVLGT